MDLSERDLIVADMLALEDEIKGIQSNREKDEGQRQELLKSEKSQRIHTEREKIQRGVEDSLDPNIFARNKRLKTVGFDISARAKEIVLSRMLPYMDYKKKVGVQDFELSEDGKILRFSYLGSPISIIWKGGKKYDYQGKQFHEIEETLLTKFGIAPTESEPGKNKKFALAPQVAEKLGLSSEGYTCTLEYEGKKDSYTGVLVRDSDMRAYTTPPEVSGEQLTFFGKTLLAYGQHETIKRGLEMRISDFYLRVFQASQKEVKN